MTQHNTARHHALQARRSSDWLIAMHAPGTPSPCAEKLCRSPLLLKHILKILEAKCLGRMLRMYWESGCGDTQICCRWVPVERMDKRTNKHWISRLCIAPDFYFFSPASCSRTRNRSIMWKDKPSLRGPLPERFAIIHHHLPSSTIIYHHPPSFTITSQSPQSLCSPRLSRYLQCSSTVGHMFSHVMICQFLEIHATLFLHIYIIYYIYNYILCMYTYNYIYTYVLVGALQSWFLRIKHSNSIEISAWDQSCAVARIFSPSLPMLPETIARCYAL